MTSPPPSAAVQPPRRPRRARAFLLAGTVCAALLFVAYAVKVVTTPGGLLFDVGVDNREPDWVKVLSIEDSAILVLADGRHYRALPRDGKPGEQQLDDMLEGDLVMGVYADMEPASGPGQVRVRLYYAWAMCGNSFLSPNPFAEVPYYKPRAEFPAERVSPE